MKRKRRNNRWREREGIGVERKRRNKRWREREVRRGGEKEKE